MMMTNQRTKWTGFIFLGLFLFNFLLHSFEQEPIEIEMKMSHGVPLVLLQIENASYFLILDSGAEKSSLNEEIIEKHRLNVTEHTYRSVNVYGTLSASQIYVADDINLEDFVCEDCEFITYFADRDHRGLDYPSELEQGVVGREFFRDKVVAIDRRGKKILIADCCSQLFSKYQDKMVDWIKLSFTQEQGIIVRVRGQDRYKRFLVDTGSNCSLIHDNSLEKQPLTPALEAILIPIETDSGAFLGNHFFLRANLSSLGVDGIIGFDFFYRFLVIFDFKNNELFLELV